MQQKMVIPHLLHINLRRRLCKEWWSDESRNCRVDVQKEKPFTVDYTGFGWVLIKHGVFENLEYPWFAPKMQVFESGSVQDMCGEDVSFCLDAKEAGFETWCDPRIRVGHEKTSIL